MEGAGAAGAGGAAATRTLQGKRVGLVLCGGNIDPCCWRPSSSAAWCARGAWRASRSARDVPGVLARITATVADAGANIEEVHHQRAFTMLAAQNVEIELVLQTRGKSHVEQVLGQLRTAGMEADAHVGATRHNATPWQNR